MAAILHTLDQRRLIDTNGIADGAEIHFYGTGTLTHASVYTTAALDVEHTQPIEVAAGAAVPDIYLDSTVTYRRRIVYPDGSVDDTDPYDSGAARATDLASTATGKGAALIGIENGGNAQDALDVYVSAQAEVATSGGADASTEAQTALTTWGLSGKRRMRWQGTGNVTLATGGLDFPVMNDWQNDFSGAQFTHQADDTLFDLHSSGDLADLNSAILRHAKVTGGSFINTAGTQTASTAFRLVSTRQMVFEDQRFEDYYAAYRISGRDSYHFVRPYFFQCEYGILLEDDITDEGAPKNIGIFVSGAHFSVSKFRSEGVFDTIVIENSSFNYGFSNDVTAVYIRSLFNGTPQAADGVHLRSIHFDPAEDNCVAIDIAGDSGAYISGIVVDGITSAFNGIGNYLWKSDYVSGVSFSGVVAGNTRSQTDDTSFATTDVSGDVITLTAHGLSTGDVCHFTTTGTLPAGLQANRFYTVIALDANTISVAKSYTAAAAATAADLTDVGTGTHTIHVCRSFAFQFGENDRQIVFGGGNQCATSPLDYRCARSEISFLQSRWPVTPKTLTGFSGDTHTTSTGTIDMYSLLGTTLPNHFTNTGSNKANPVPANVTPRAYRILLGLSGDASATQATQVWLAPRASGYTSNNALALNVTDVANGTKRQVEGLVPADENGDIYYNIAAGGASNASVWITVTEVVY